MDLYVDGWKVQEIENIATKDVKWLDTFEGEEDISESTSEKYLGQIICNDGSNVKNVANRAAKGFGMGNTIESILKYVPGGQFHFQIALVIRNA